MNTKTTRPHSRVLLIHDGQPVDGYVRYLTDAGLSVRKAQPGEAVTSALSFEPNIIVLDFDCDGDVIAALNALEETRHIPVIALAQLTRQ